MLALVAVITFSVVPSFQAPDGHNFVAYYLIILVAVGLVPIHWSVKVFVGICAASCVWLQVMTACVYPRELSVLFARLYISANCDFQFVVIFTGLYAMFVYARPKMETWLNFLAWVALVEVLRISVQRLGWDPFYVPVNLAKSITVAAGSQGNIGWSGAVLALCVPAFLRRVYWWGLIPLGLALYVEHSLTPVLAGTAAVLVYAVLNTRGTTRIIIIMLCIYAAGFFWGYVDSGDGGHRFAVWRRAVDLSMHREAWLLGYGLGSWLVIFPDGVHWFLRRTHNDILQVWFELGAMGVLAMGLYGWFVISRIIRARPWGRADRIGRISNKRPDVIFAASGLVAVVLCSLGNFPFHTAGAAVVAVAWMGMFEVIAKKQSAISIQQNQKAFRRAQGPEGNRRADS